jgi:hypothetical protein
MDPISLFSRTWTRGQLGLVSARGQRPHPAVAANDAIPQRRGPVRFKIVVEADIEQGNSKGDQLGDHINFWADQGISLCLVYL